MFFHNFMLTIFALISDMVQDGWLLGSVDATDAERGSEAGGHGEEKKSGLKNSSLEWVPCPVCGKSITGSNSCINDHIGKQLSKLNQK